MSRKHSGINVYTIYLSPNNHALFGRFSAIQETILYAKIKRD